MTRNAPLLAALLLLAAPSARAADAVRMDAEAGIGNVVRAGAWTPVTVRLENPGAAVNGKVIVRFSDLGQTKGTAEEPVELPTGAKKQVTLYARAGGGMGRFEVSLEDAKGNVRAGPVELTIGAVEDRTAIVALVSMGAHTDPGLRPLITAETRVVGLDADQLPENWPALKTFDAIVLRDPDTAKLGPARIAALKAWVAGGGNLSVVTAEKWRAMDEPSFTEMLPVRVKGVRTADASTLPFPFSEQKGQVAVAVAEHLRGRTLVSTEDGAPFIAIGKYGLGRVAFFAADTGDLPDVDAREKAAIWAGVLDLPPELEDDPNQPNYGYGQSAESFIAQELSRIPPLKPPSVLLVTVLIGLYVLVVGPGDYFLLKRMGKLHWTWATYPAAIAAFSGMIYLYARLSRSSDMMVRTIALVDAATEPPTAPSPLHIFGGVYSPRAGRFKVGVKVPDAVSGGFAQESQGYGMGGPSSTEYLVSGGKHPSLTLSIPIWSMAGVQIDSVTNDPAPFLVDRAADGAVEVTNTGADELAWVALLVDGKVVDGGKLATGGHVRLSRGDAGKKLSELPTDMSQSMWGAEHSKEDLSRIVRVFAFATDPPSASGQNDPYYLPRAKRRLGSLERPREEKGTPMVFVVARNGSLPIDVEGETAAGSGLTVWRRPVLAANSGEHP